VPNSGVRRILSSLAVVLLLAAACGRSVAGPEPPAQATPPGPVQLAPGEKLRVVATTNLVGDVVGRVGGDRIHLTTLMGWGVDPHSYVPSPRDTAAVYDANLLFANGAGLEIFLAEMLANAGGRAVRVYLSSGLQLRTLNGGAPDPHVWFDAQNVIHWVNTVEQFLGALDPSNAAAYQANAAAYIVELQALDAWIVQQVAMIPQANRKLVIDHPVFGYFSDRYGFEQIGAVYPLNPSAEPSAQDVAALERTMRQFSVPAVFSESTVSPKLADQVARDTGVKLFLLYTDSLGGPGTPAATYLDMMHYDVQAIVSALR
jgi:ABC-type Zn uptake system ZnuABC Zn-binding protein ZnuA